MGRLSLFLLLLPALIACGGAEGHYAIDRELTAAAMDRVMEQELAATFVRMHGENAQVPDEVRKRMKEERDALLAQLEMEIHLEPGGTFTGSARVEKETETAEGTWKLDGDRLLITTTRENGKDLGSPKTEALRYQDGRLSFEDPEASHPFLVFSRQ